MNRAEENDLRKQRRKHARNNRKAENQAIAFTTQRAYRDAFAEFIRLSRSRDHGQDHNAPEVEG